MTIAGLRYRLVQAWVRTRYAGHALASYGRFATSRRRRFGVTAVLSGRNDDYMPDFASRLEATIEWNLKYLADEVVFVEWNPPPERPLLGPALAARFPAVRGFVVGGEIHSRVCRNPDVPLLEFHAKNVGIRRAKGDWICATNADAAFGLDSAVRVARAQSDPSVVWTAQRVDIRWPETRKRSLGLTDCLGFKRLIPYTELGSGEFTLAHRDLWLKATGYDESQDRHRLGCDTRGVAQMLHLGATVRRAGVVLHLSHPTSCTEGVKRHHGDWAPLDGLPYRNPDDWGLAAFRELPIGERVWRVAP